MAAASSSSSSSAGTIAAVEVGESGTLDAATGLNPRRFATVIGGPRRITDGAATAKAATTCAD
jgi:hypothetical protein